MHFIIIKNVKESRRASLARMTRNQEAHSFIFSRRKLHRRALFPPNFYCLGIYNISPSNLIAARTKSERERDEKHGALKAFFNNWSGARWWERKHTSGMRSARPRRNTLCNFLGNQQGAGEFCCRPRRSAQGRLLRVCGCWLSAACARMTSATTPRALFQRGKEAHTYRLPTSSGCTGVRGQVPPLCSPLSASNEGCTGALIVFQPRSISYNAAKNAETRC